MSFVSQTPVIETSDFEPVLPAPKVIEGEVTVANDRYCAFGRLTRATGGKRHIAHYGNFVDHSGSDMLGRTELRYSDTRGASWSTATTVFGGSGLNCYTPASGVDRDGRHHFWARERISGTTLHRSTVDGITLGPVSTISAVTGDSVTSGTFAMASFRLFGKFHPDPASTTGGMYGYGYHVDPAAPDSDDNPDNDNQNNLYTAFYVRLDSNGINPALTRIGRTQLRPPVDTDHGLGFNEGALYAPTATDRIAVIRCIGTRAPRVFTSTDEGVTWTDRGFMDIPVSGGWLPQEMGTHVEGGQTYLDLFVGLRRPASQSDNFGEPYPGPAVGVLFCPLDTAMTSTATCAITSASWASSTITLTVPTAKNIAVGQNFVVSGMTPSGWNGTHAAISGTVAGILKATLANPGTATVMGVATFPTATGWKFGHIHSWAYNSAAQLDAYVSHDYDPDTGSWLLLSHDEQSSSISRTFAYGTSDLLYGDRSPDKPDYVERHELGEAAFIDRRDIVGGDFVSISSARTVTRGEHGKVFVATASLALTLPAASTVQAEFQIILKGRGGNITVTPNSADAINGGTTGSTVLLIDGTSALLRRSSSTGWELLHGPNLAASSLTVLASAYVTATDLAGVRGALSYVAALSPQPRAVAITAPIGAGSAKYNYPTRIDVTWPIGPHVTVQGTSAVSFTLSAAPVLSISGSLNDYDVGIKYTGSTPAGMATDVPVRVRVNSGAFTGGANVQQLAGTHRVTSVDTATNSFVMKVRSEKALDTALVTAALTITEIKVMRTQLNFQLSATAEHQGGFHFQENSGLTFDDIALTGNRTLYGDASTSAATDYGTTDTAAFFISRGAHVICDTDVAIMGWGYAGVENWGVFEMGRTQISDCAGNGLYANHNSFTQIIRGGITCAHIGIVAGIGSRVSTSFPTVANCDDAIQSLQGSYVYIASDGYVVNNDRAYYVNGDSVIYAPSAVQSGNTTTATIEDTGTIHYFDGTRTRVQTCPIGALSTVTATLYPSRGVHAVITDSNTSAPNATIAGGGAIVVEATGDGTNFVVVTRLT